MLSFLIFGYPQPSVTLDYTGGTAATYPGLDHFDRIAQQPWTTTAGTLDLFNYCYDYASNRLTRQNAKAATLWDEQYLYDGAYRLNASKRGTLSGGTISGTPARQENWGLDSTGNWSTFSQATTGTTTLSQTRSHNPANELLSIAGTGAFTSAFDNVGNMTSLPKSGSGSLALSCTYDAWNRLKTTSDGTTVVNYSYDGEGRRLSKSTTASATDYYLAAQQVVETSLTISGATSLQYQYVWSPRYIDAPILRDDFTTTPARIYYLDDANFNVNTLTGTDGGVLERVVYSAYGVPTFYNATWSGSGSGSSSYSNTILYTGRELDAETGLYYYRARYYRAELGRFVSRDPIGYVSGLNLYESCLSNPPKLSDPLGLQPPSPTGFGSLTIDTSATASHGPGVSWNKYWIRWQDKHKGLTDAQMKWAERQLARGCIGVVGVKVGHNPNFGNCFATLKIAKGYLASYERVKCSQGCHAAIFGLHYYMPTGPLKADSHGKVDMLPWVQNGQSLRPPGLWNARSGGGLGMPFDFGYLAGNGLIYHADSVYNPRDPKTHLGHYFPDSEIVNNASVYASKVEVFGHTGEDRLPGRSYYGYRDFNGQVWCLDCVTEAYSDKPLPLPVNK